MHNNYSVESKSKKFLDQIQKSLRVPVTLPTELVQCESGSILMNDSSPIIESFCYESVFLASNDIQLESMQ